MLTNSIWQAASEKTGFQPLSGHAEADIVIIGAGITGITAAMLPKQAGQSVVVLEALKAGQGTTGHSTGNLYGTVDSLLYNIKDTRDVKTAQAVVRSRNETVDFIERIIAEYGISCSFSRRPLYLFSTETAQDKNMSREYTPSLKQG